MKEVIRRQAIQIGRDFEKAVAALKRETDTGERAGIAAAALELLAELSLLSGDGPPPSPDRDRLLLLERFSVEALDLLPDGEEMEQEAVRLLEAAGRMCLAEAGRRPPDDADRAEVERILDLRSGFLLRGLGRALLLERLGWIAPDRALPPWTAALTARAHEAASRFDRVALPESFRLIPANRFRTAALDGIGDGAVRDACWWLSDWTGLPGAVLQFLPASAFEDDSAISGASLLEDLGFSRVGSPSVIRPVSTPLPEPASVVVERIAAAPPLEQGPFRLFEVYGRREGQRIIEVTCAEIDGEVGVTIDLSRLPQEYRPCGVTGSLNGRPLAVDEEPDAFHLPLGRRAGLGGAWIGLRTVVTVPTDEGPVATELDFDFDWDTADGMRTN